MRLILKNQGMLYVGANSFNSWPQQSKGNRFKVTNKLNKNFPDLDARAKR